MLANGPFVLSSTWLFARLVELFRFPFFCAVSLESSEGSGRVPSVTHCGAGYHIHHTCSETEGDLVSEDRVCGGGSITGSPTEHPEKKQMAGLLPRRVTSLFRWRPLSVFFFALRMGKGERKREALKVINDLSPLCQKRQGESGVGLHCVRGSDRSSQKMPLINCLSLRDHIDSLCDLTPWHTTPMSFTQWVMSWRPRHISDAR